MGEVVVLYNEQQGEFVDMKNKDSSSSSETPTPRMLLRVLLVEADDSTRRILSALLRKCSYTVAAVSDGLKAWESLKTRSHDIDLILTEVELPSISGYALLTLIMEHDVCKNIPVIMMSSQDSISIVLKCMLRGAADFLIKPVRKNELRNLWQHVWRRQTQTAGNVPQNTTAAKRKASCENKVSGNHSSDFLVYTQETKDEKGSDAQSTSTSYLEAASPRFPNMQGMLPMRCKSASYIINEDGPEENVNLVKKSIKHTSEIGGKQSTSRPEEVFHLEVYKSTESSLGEGPAWANRENDNRIGEMHGHTDEIVEASSAIDLISKFGNYPADSNGCFSANCGVNKYSVGPYLDLSLRRTYPVGFTDEGTIEQQKLKHSNASAFSWYDNSKILQPLFPTMDSDCGHEAVLSSIEDNLKTEAVSQSGQFEEAPPRSQLGVIPLVGLSLDTWQNYIPPLSYTQPHALLVSVGGCQQSSVPVSSSLHSFSEICNSEQGCHRDETAKSADNLQKNTNMGPVEGLRDGSPLSYVSASISLCSGVADKLNSSVCGSICSTVDNNSNSSAAVAKFMVSESVNQNHLLVSDGLTGMESHCPTQREASLLKFRLKRKDRCFDKRVRYQSRKRLAEQRPRVKGQFVRQVQPESCNADGCQ